MKIEKQKYFWERAGNIGYSKLMFTNKLVKDKILKRQWQVVIEIGKNLGLNQNSRIIELGCGDILGFDSIPDDDYVN